MNAPVWDYLGTALFYGSLRWPVLPVHNPSAANGCPCRRPMSCQPKRPFLRHWPSRASANPEQIRTWWTEWPEANIAVVTGSRAGLLVLDIDKGTGGEDSFSELEQRNSQLPRTAEARTGGGGRHLFFRSPAGDFVPTSQGRLGKGLDVRAQKGMALVAPSLHPSGVRYRWIGEPKLSSLAVAPAWLLSLARSPSRGPAGDSGPSILVEGQRNAGLTRVAGLCRMIGLSDESLAQVLLIVNRTRCRPPLPLSEVEAMTRQAAGWSAPPNWIVKPTEFVLDDRLSATDRARVAKGPARRGGWPRQADVSDPPEARHRREVDQAAAGGGSDLPQLPPHGSE